MSFIEKLLEVFVPWKSKKWVMWKAQLDLRTCEICRDQHGRIFPTEKVGSMVVWPAHLYCRCQLNGMDVIPAGRATEAGEDGADYYLANKGKLPSNYISKKDAKALGWESKKGNLANVADGEIIGGDIYKNNEGRLPQANGRIWYEADINYTSGYRGNERIFYSNDGLIFVSYDHGYTFYEITNGIGE